MTAAREAGGIGALAPLTAAQAAAIYPPERFQILKMDGLGGSTEHYYHFILGFVAPILMRLPRAPGQPGLLAKSCAVLDERFLELGVEDVVLLPGKIWLELEARGGYEVITLASLDRKLGLRAATSGLFRQQVVLLRNEVYRRLKVRDLPRRPGVLVIGRGAPPVHYLSATAEVGHSANLRRSIPNMDEIVNLAAAAGLAAELFHLEDVTLQQQVTLFSAARVVVAQHGAALVNMLWMRPGGIVVEIMPPVVQHNIFRKMAKCCGHHYFRVAQESPHAAVDPDAVISVLRRAMA